MKLNIGSNNIKLDGYINIDGLMLENVDAVCELHKAPYYLDVVPASLYKFGDSLTPAKGYEGKDVFTLKSGSVDEILAVEFLEHISFKQTDVVVQEWYRLLKFDGKLSVQVPDCGKAMEYYVNNEICECVPHKGTPEQQVADENCFVCGGKAKINPTRWLYSFTGAQKHEFDAHLNIFTREKMKELLEKAGFEQIKFQDDKYKIKVTAIK